MPVLATDPLYILYTSGTTGIPKGVVRDNGGHLVALKWSMFNLYGVKPGEVWWCGSDIGWVVGHSYIVYAPLFHGATSIMYEGKPIGTPDAGAFWRVICGTRGGRVLHGTDRVPCHQARKTPKANSSGSTIFPNSARCFSPANAPIRRRWNGRKQQLKVPVVDHWWQTETGWCIAGNPVGLGMLPVKHGSPTVPMPGYQVEVFDEAAKPLACGHHGFDRDQAADAAGLPADTVGAGCALQGSLFQRIPRLLQNL